MLEQVATDADKETGWKQASPDFRFAAAIAAYGLILRESPHKASADWKLVHDMAAGALAKDPGGYRAEFVELAKAASDLGKK